MPDIDCGVNGAADAALDSDATAMQCTGLERTAVDCNGEPYLLAVTCFPVSFPSEHKVL